LLPDKVNYHALELSYLSENVKYYFVVCKLKMQRKIKVNDFNIISIISLLLQSFGIIVCFLVSICFY